MAEINPQFIRSGADELVVLTRAEFDALMARPDPDAEDEADAVLFAERMEALTAGRDVCLPRDVSRSMLDGDSLLRALRKWRKLTQTEVAKRTNLTQSYISDLESGIKPGSHNALGQIANALDVPADWVVPDGMAQD